MRGHIFKAKLHQGDEETTQSCLWGRRRAHSNDSRGVAGIDRVFVGHTPQWGGVRRYGNVYAIDTGAVFGRHAEEDQGKLTMASLLCCTKAISSNNPEETGLVAIRDLDVVGRPFGSHVIA